MNSATTVFASLVLEVSILFFASFNNKKRWGKWTHLNEPMKMFFGRLERLTRVFYWSWSPKAKSTAGSTRGSSKRLAEEGLTTRPKVVFVCKVVLDGLSGASVSAWTFGCGDSSKIKLGVSLTETNPFGRARQASDTKGEGEGSLNDFTKRDDDHMMIRKNNGMILHLFQVMAIYGDFNWWWIVGGESFPR